MIFRGDEIKEFSVIRMRRIYNSLNILVRNLKATSSKIKQEVSKDTVNKLRSYGKDLNDLADMCEAALEGAEVVNSKRVPGNFTTSPEMEKFLEAAKGGK